MFPRRPSSSPASRYNLWLLCKSRYNLFWSSCAGHGARAELDRRTEGSGAEDEQGPRPAALAWRPPYQVGRPGVLADRSGRRLPAIRQVDWSGEERRTVVAACQGRVDAGAEAAV